MFGAFGNATQGLAAQYPIGAEKLPSEHSREMDAVALYPLLQAGVHTDPDAVSALHVENVSLAVSGSRGHGFGLHTPAGMLNTPVLQVICSEEEALYPLLQTGTQTLPVAVRKGHCVE